MNERIKELMEQAGLYDFVIESMGINEEMEKFAQLIVAECCQALSPMLRDMISRGQGVELIKQQFGLE
jgi:hypothetical protein